MDVCKEESLHTSVPSLWFASHTSLHTLLHVWIIPSYAFTFVIFITWISHRLTYFRFWRIFITSYMMNVPIQPEVLFHSLIWMNDYPLCQHIKRTTCIQEHLSSIQVSMLQEDIFTQKSLFSGGPRVSGTACTNCSSHCGLCGWPVTHPLYIYFTATLHYWISML